MKQNTPHTAPHTVREMTDADCLLYNIERADFGEDVLWLAVWTDRSGWYTYTPLNRHERDAFPFSATVINESECFESAEEAQAWLYSHLN